MGTLILRRLAAMVPVLLLVTFGVFSLIHLTPGDPIDAMMGESFDAAAKERMRVELGLDQPIYVQYLSWIGRALQGDFGRFVRLLEQRRANADSDTQVVADLGQADVFDTDPQSLGKRLGAG